MRTSSRQRAWALSDPRLSSPAKMRKRCFYDQWKFGSICGSLSPFPTHLSLITNINPFATLSRIKCVRYIFIKKCVRSFIEVIFIVDYVSACICICMWLYNTWIPTISLSLSLSLSIRPYWPLHLAGLLGMVVFFFVIVACI